MLEVIFVDDSTDNTPEMVESAAERFDQLNVRLIHRAPREAYGWPRRRCNDGPGSCAFQVRMRDGRRSAASAGNGARAAQDG